MIEWALIHPTMQTWSITLHGPLGVISTVDTGESQFVIGTETASDVFTVIGHGVRSFLLTPFPQPAHAVSSRGALSFHRFPPDAPSDHDDCVR